VNTLARAEAWLEAHWPSEEGPSWSARELMSESHLPMALNECWAELLQAETELWHVGETAALEARFAAVISNVEQENLPTYAALEASRIGSRAAAALVRARIAQQREDGGVLETLSGRLPMWEWAYLHGLSRWAVGDEAGARTSLQDALARNGHQTAVRAALAPLLASASVEQTLDLLSGESATREMLHLRAALLARRRRYAEAEETLTGQARVAPYEAARYSWAAGRRLSRVQEQLLVVALAERRGDFKKAATTWHAEAPAEFNKSLYDARRLFAARRELTNVSMSRAWDHDLAARSFESSLRQVTSIPMIGDGLFFRAWSLIDRDPPRAGRDFTTLLRQRTWVDTERSAGATRILVAADVLLQLGQLDEALTAYELLGSASEETRSRYAVALVYSKLRSHSPIDVLRQVSDHALELAPASPWPQLLSALGAVMCGNPEEASTRVAMAEGRGAPDKICRVLRALSGLSPLNETELCALHLPTRAEATVRLLCGDQPDGVRVEAFAAAFGDQWTAFCPADVEWMGRVLVSALCDAGRWDEAERHANELARGGHGHDLVCWMRLRKVLARAVRGDLTNVDCELLEIETKLS
jgi:hypothetical protein